jgi:hypothetical protein
MKIGGRKGVHRFAHRLSYEAFVGPIPDGMCVCHKCDNPPCVNPDHLFLGTQSDNQRDKVAKGRQARGDRHKAKTHPETVTRGSDHYNTHLTEVDVKRMRDAKACGVPTDVLAWAFKTSKANVRTIARRESWKHVE